MRSSWCGSGTGTALLATFQCRPCKADAHEEDFSSLPVCEEDLHGAPRRDEDAHDIGFEAQLSEALPAEATKPCSPVVDRIALCAAGGPRAAVRRIPDPGSRYAPSWPWKAICEQVVIRADCAGLYFVERLLGDISQLLEPHLERSFTSYIVYEQPAEPLEEEMALERGGFMLLALDRGPYYICLDRSDDVLEIMIGAGEAMRVYAELFRAGGRERSEAPATLQASLPEFVGPEEELPEVRVSDFVQWLRGPLAKCWGSSPDLRAQLAFFLRAGPATGPGGCTALIAASYRGDTNLVARLLDSAAEPSHADDEGCTALVWAARLGRDPCVKLLLAARATPDERDVDGATALSWAARNGHSEVCARLLRAGADPSLDGLRGFSPLGWGAQNGHLGVTTLLLQLKAKVSHQNHDGNTPLVLAALSGHWAVIGKLVASGDFEAQDGPRAMAIAKAHVRE